MEEKKESVINLHKKSDFFLNQPSTSSTSGLYKKSLDADDDDDEEEGSFETAKGFTETISVQSDLTIGKSDIILNRLAPENPPPYQSLPIQQNAVERQQQVPQYSPV